MDRKRAMHGLILFMCSTTCCLTQSQYCPNGGTVLYQSGSYPQTCSLSASTYGSNYASSYYGSSYYGSSSYGSCPYGYTCQSSSIYSSGGYSSGYCCSSQYGSSYTYGNNYGTGYTGYGTGYGTNYYGNGYGTTGYYSGTSGYGYGSSAYGQSCPNGATPYPYLGSNMPLSCTVGMSQCPGTSVCQCSGSSYSSYCTSGTSGICCMSGYNYGGSAYGYGSYQQTEQTGDPYCPTAVIGVTCSSGSTTCSQYGSQFVCQYSNTRQQFRCCSTTGSSYFGRKKRSPKYRKIST